MCAGPQLIQLFSRKMHFKRFGAVLLFRGTFSPHKSVIAPCLFPRQEKKSEKTSHGKNLCDRFIAFSASKIYILSSVLFKNIYAHLLAQENCLSFKITGNGDYGAAGNLEKCIAPLYKLYETKDECSYKVVKRVFQKSTIFSSLWNTVGSRGTHICELGFAFTEKVIKIVTEHNLWKETETFKNIKCFFHALFSLWRLLHWSSTYHGDMTRDLIAP